MSEKHTDKTLAVRVPVPLFEKFKSKCEANFKNMSDVVRDFICEYSADEEWLETFEKYIVLYRGLHHQNPNLTYSPETLMPFIDSAERLLKRVKQGGK